MAHGDVLAWRDAAGVRHFTNRIETIPTEHRARAEVVVVSVPEAVAHPGGAAVPPAATPDLPAAEIEAAYRAGLLAGTQLGSSGGGGGGAAEGGAVEISGPLAVTTVHVAPYAEWGWGPGGYDFPLVTTGFDRGRSRHQTLRMLLQDQFQSDRNGPYAYQRWSRPGLGPALSPALPRGLLLPPQQFGRVVYR